MIDDALTGTVIGCAMDVHRELGPGYLEKVYENALTIALSDAGIGVAQQVAVPAQFRGRVVGDFVADLLVEGNLIVELKAVSNLLPVHETQLVSYLKATGFDVGLLINFGAGSLQVKRKYREYRPALATNQDRITGFSGFTGGVSRSSVNPANPGIPFQNAAPGGTGPENGIPKTNPVNPANPAILSKNAEQGSASIPEQGGAWIPKNNPVHPANPAILSKTPEQGGPWNPPNHPAHPETLSTNGAWQ